VYVLCIEFTTSKFYTYLYHQIQLLDRYSTYTPVRQVHTLQSSLLIQCFCVWRLERNKQLGRCKYRWSDGAVVDIQEIHFEYGFVWFSVGRIGGMVGTAVRLRVS